MKTVIPLKMALPALLAGAALGYSVAQVRQPGHGATTAPLASSNSPGATGSIKTEEGSRKESFKSLLSQSTEREALRWLRARWGTLRSDDYKAAANDLLAVGTKRFEKLFGELLQSWSRTAPLDALAFLDTLPPEQRDAKIFFVINGWALTDPDALLAWHRKSTEPEKNRYMILQALSASRPDAIFALLEEQKSKTEKKAEVPYSGFLYALASEDPAHALQFFNRLSPSEREASIASLVSGWDDPEAAIAWVGELPKGPLRESGFLSIINLLSTASPREAAQLAMRELNSSDSTSSAAYTLIRQWADADPAEAMDFVDASPSSPFKKKALEVIEGEFATRAPEEYLDRLLEKQDFSNLGSIWSASNALFKKDPHAFQEWFTKNWRDIPAEQISQVIWGPTTADPELGVKLLALLPEGSHTDSAYQSAGSNWGQKDMEAARRYMETLPPGTARERFQIGLIATLASSDLAAALKEAEKMTNPKQQSQLLSNIASNSQNIEEVAAWLQARPESKQTKSLYQTLTSQWVFRDSKGAATWIEKLPEGAGKEESVRIYALHIVENEPQAAIQWAGKIHDEKEREKTLTSIASRWKDIDKAAAEAWIKDSPLPEKIKESYLKQ